MLGLKLNHVSKRGHCTMLLGFFFFSILLCTFSRIEIHVKCNEEPDKYTCTMLLVFSFSILLCTFSGIEIHVKCSEEPDECTYTMLLVFLFSILLCTLRGIEIDPFLWFDLDIWCLFIYIIYLVDTFSHIYHKACEQHIYIPRVTCRP